MRKVLPGTRKTKLYEQEKKEKYTKANTANTGSKEYLFFGEKHTPTICILRDSRYIVFAKQEKVFIRKGSK